MSESDDASSVASGASGAPSVTQSMRYGVARQANTAAVLETSQMHAAPARELQFTDYRHAVVLWCRDNEGPGGGSAEQPDGMENNHDIAAAVFGVVYTLSKDKRGQSYRFAAAHMVLDFLQLFLLIFAPNFGWHMKENLW